MASVVVPFAAENTITVNTLTTIEGRPFDVGDYREMNVNAFVRGVSGTTPEMTIVVQESMDMLEWRTLGTFTMFTVPGNQKQNLGNFLRYVRLLTTVDGTPGTFTYYVYGIAKD